MNAADSRAHARKETPKNFARFPSVNKNVLHRSVELNIPEDNQCLRFILCTVKTFGNVEALRRESSCWLSLLGQMILHNK